MTNQKGVTHCWITPFQLVTIRLAQYSSSLKKKSSFVG